MSEPSWLPDTWPSTSPDIETHYRRMAPRQWPQGLYDENGDAYLDQTAVGHVFSWVRKMSWWVMDRYHPQHDTDTSPYLIHLWESLFGLASSQTITERIYNVLASIRHRGTGIDDLVKSIFTAVFGVPDDSTQVSIASPSPDNTYGGSIAWQKMPWLDSSDQALPKYDFNAIHGHDETYVWAVGDGGKIFLGEQSGSTHSLDDFRWTEKTSGTANQLNDVHSWSDCCAVAVGNTNTVQLWFGGVWAALAGHANPPNWTGVTMSGKYWDTVLGGYLPEYVWICGDNDKVDQYDVRNATWINHTPEGGGVGFVDIDATSNTAVIALKSDGQLFYWDGTTWASSHSLISPATVCKVFGEHAIWWVSGATYTKRKTGTVGSWVAHNLPGGVTPSTMDGQDENRLIVISGSSCFRWDGTGWETIATNCWENLNGLFCCNNSAFAFACGENSWVLRTPDVNAVSETFAVNQMQMHIYSTGQDLDPDYGLGLDKIKLVQPVQQHWSLGRRLTLRASDSNEASGASNACAS